MSSKFVVGASRTALSLVGRVSAIKTTSAVTKAPLFSTSVQRRHFNNNATKTSSTAQPAAATANVNVAVNAAAKSSGNAKLKYLETLSTRDLISYFVIGLATLNKTTLKLATKSFPYTPMGIIKLFISNIYCGGDTPQDVIATGKKLATRNINNMMISYTVEDSDGTKNLDINQIVEETISSIDSILIPHTEAVIKKSIENGGTANDIPAGYIALKPSALVANPADVMKHYKDPAFAGQWQELIGNCSKIIEHIYERNQALLAKYPDRQIPLLVGVIDAEKYELQQAVYELQRILYQKYNPVDKPVSVVGTIQMYLKQSYDVLLKDQQLAKEGNFKIGVKLVRGAYIHTEPDRGVIHNTKHDTDVNYNKGIKHAIEDILTAKEPTIGHLVVASHNRESQVNATSLLSQHQDNKMKNNITLGQLLGMADDITFDLVTNYNVKNIIKYVAWGPPQETRDYLLRRLEENGDAVRNDNGWPLVKGVVGTLLKRAFSFK